MGIHISTPDDFRDLVLPGPTSAGGREGIHLEFKSERGDVRDTAIDIASMANAEGGTILFGVKESKARRSVVESIYALDVRRAFQHIHQALDVWMIGFSHVLATREIRVGQQVAIALHVFPSPGLVCVPARDGGLYYPVRTIEDTRMLSADEVEVRITSYAARARRIQLREKEEDFKKRSLSSRDLSLYHIDPDTHVTRVWNATETSNFYPNAPRSCRFLHAADDWAEVQFKTKNSELVFNVPYDWILGVWEDPATDGDSRLAMKVAAYFMEEQVGERQWRLSGQMF